jgi:anti-sigma B factor antagonist
MLDIRTGDNGEILLSGRFDASQAAKAQEYMDTLSGTRVVDLRELEYISSAGLGVLLKTQKRLSGAGGELQLANLNRHIQDVFRYSGFDQIFKILPGSEG